MALILNSDNEAIVKDNISNTDIKIFYRMPNTEERVNFRSKVGFNLEQINERVDTAVEYGLKLITGFRKGDIKIADNIGKIKDISSNPKDPEYEPEWKKLLKEYRPDILEALAYRIYFNPCDILTGQEKN